MESKYLKIIQVLARIGQIMCKVIHICCIVGGIGCLIGITSMLGIDARPVTVGGVTIHSMIENSANMTVDTMYAYMLSGFFVCLAESIITRFAERYFKNELAAGTPFTMEGAKELFRLGIITAAVSVGINVTAEIVCDVLSKTTSFIADGTVSKYSDNVGFGVAFVIIALLMMYGSELRAQAPAQIEAVQDAPLEETEVVE